MGYGSNPNDWQLNYDPTQFNQYQKPMNPTWNLAGQLGGGVIGALGDALFDSEQDKYLRDRRRRMNQGWNFMNTNQQYGLGGLGKGGLSPSLIMSMMANQRQAMQPTMNQIAFNSGQITSGPERERMQYNSMMPIMSDKMFNLQQLSEMYKRQRDQQILSNYFGLAGA